MTQRRSGAMLVLRDRSLLTDITVRTHDVEAWPLEVDRQEEGGAFIEMDAGPVGFNLVLPDVDAGDLLVLSGFTWRGVLTIDGG